jgi:peroxiredoxin
MRMNLIKISAIFIGAFMFSAFSITNAQNQGYRIQVKVHKLQDSVSYLGYHFGDKRYIKDTVKVSNGAFTFQGEEKQTGGIYFIYTPNHYFEILMDEDQHFSIETDTVDFIKNMKVKNSKDNELFRDLRVYIGERQKKGSELSEKLKAAKGTPQEKAILAQLEELEKEVVFYQDQIITNHPQTLTAMVLRATRKMEIPEPPKNNAGEPIDPNFQFNYYKKHFFDQIDLTDSRFLRTNFFHSKITEYIEKLTHPHPDSVSKSVQYMIDLTKGNKEMFRYLLVTMTSKYETSEIMGMDKVFVDLAEKYYLTGKADWADTSVVNKIRNKVNDIKPNLIGNKAPQLILYDSLKRPVNALSGKSRFTILFFFDPDCGHCKTITPKLKNIYGELKGKGADVIGVCTDVNLDAMKDFLKDLSLPWNTFADLAGQRRSYNITSTPVIYILDENKRIIAKRLDVEQIMGFLDHQIEIGKKGQELGKR